MTQKQSRDAADLVTGMLLDVVEHAASNADKIEAAKLYFDIACGGPPQTWAVEEALTELNVRLTKLEKAALKRGKTTRRKNGKLRRWPGTQKQ